VRTLKPIPEPPAAPLVDPLRDVFPPSLEVGDVLRGLHEEQDVLDRRKAEELARLREIQDRD
jgi:hypothetical protein